MAELKVTYIIPDRRGDCEQGDIFITSHPPKIILFMVHSKLQDNKINILTFKGGLLFMRFPTEGFGDVVPHLVPNPYESKLTYYLDIGLRARLFLDFCMSKWIATDQNFWIADIDPHTLIVDIELLTYESKVEDLVFEFHPSVEAFYHKESGSSEEFPILDWPFQCIEN